MKEYEKRNIKIEIKDAPVRNIESSKNLKN